MPFYNAARDTEMVKVEPPRLPNETWWEDDPYYQAQLWFNSPDSGELFDTPEVPTEHYDPSWYEYRNIQVTALICYPNYEEFRPAGVNIGGEKVEAPFFDWFVVNFSLGEWELLEAFRWNSPMTTKLERGQWEYESGDSPTDAGSTMDSQEATTDASNGTDPYTAYEETRYSDASLPERCNPLLMACGRPICKRAADAFEEALDNPSFNTIDTQEYHKAIALQTFIGSSPYSFEYGSYDATPEEAINRWYEASVGERDGAGNCQDGAHLYNGIALNLLDSGVANLTMEAPGAHITAGLINLSRPETAFEQWVEGHPVTRTAEPYELETEYGNISMVECTYSDPTIGWKLNRADNIQLQTFLTNTSINSCAPLNDNFEPDVNGRVRVDYKIVEIPWEFHEVATDTIKDVDNL